ncbi:hypothetical protein AVEN_20702-1 [Araneus ventricosus]|uniref:Uncharacterized protein n=1 Tax=Araneus ventricosus TaxID=182803 RepID=A0A4Y2HSE9_ARAVE|nr:hypothetical protein AVEN_20702-1 [Araneus ventricosus]
MHHTTEESQLALFRDYLDGEPLPYGPKPTAQTRCCEKQKSLPPVQRSELPCSSFRLHSLPPPHHHRLRLFDYFINIDRKLMGTE